MQPEPSRGFGRAAAIGAGGCFTTFLVIGSCVAATGGTVYADGGGILMLLVIGAVLGLGVWALYDKGKRDAQRTFSAAPGDERSVDDLIHEAQRDFRAGRIDKDEYDRRVRRAWGHRDEPA